MGDFNLDENKIYSEQYAFKHHFRDLEECWQDLNLTQLIKFDTWSRIVNGTKRVSRLDHIYTNNPHILTPPESLLTGIGDHLAITTDINTKSKQLNKAVTFRDWRGYSVEKLTEKLQGINFCLDISPVQDLYNHIERKIIEAVDELVPMRTITQRKKTMTPYLNSLINKKRKLTRKVRTFETTGRLKEVNKEIRAAFNSRKRNSIRKIIKPGDPVSLWAAVKESQQVENPKIPEEVELNGIKYTGNERPAAFAEEFQNKVKSLVDRTVINMDNY